MPLHDAQRFMKVSEESYDYEAIIKKRDAELVKCNDRLDTREERIANYILNEASFKTDKAALQDDVRLLEGEAKLQEKRVKNQKLQKIFIVIGAGIVEVLTIILLIR